MPTSLRQAPVARFHRLSGRGLSLRTKVFFLFAGASLLIVVPTLALIARAVERRVYERATEDLAGAANALGSNWSLRDEVLLNEAAARAQSSGLPAALAERDVPRIRQIFQRRPAAERIAVAADSGGNRLLGPTIDPTILSNNQGIGSILTYSAEDETPLRVAVWPVWSDSGFAGVAGVGARVDSAAIQELKKDVTAGTEVALIIGDSIVGTTLPDSLRDGLARLQLGVGLRNGATGREILRGAPYQYRLSTLPTRGLPAAVLLFRPIQNELRIATGIQRTLFGIGFAALVLALLLAGVVARIVARPAQALADASARLARGDFRAPLPPASGDEIGQLTIAFAEMRTAIAEREGRLRSAQAEMIHREKLAAMGRLVAQLSHEINNPIYNIQNCLEALARRGDPHDPNREFLLLAQEELARMAALTRQMLDQSRPLSDAATPLDLNQVVKRVLAFSAEEATTRGVRLEPFLARDLPRVVAHPDAIQQVLANLVRNGIDAMPEGGSLRVITRADGDALEIAVEDTGTGISDEDLPHIFEAFYTTKPGVQGIGLGLFVSEGIIRGHRGRLSVESRPGKGSRFVVRLPRETLDETISGEAGGAPARTAIRA